MTYLEIAEKQNNPHLKEVYKIIAKDAGETYDVAHSIPENKLLGVKVNDSPIPAISHTIDSIEAIRENLYKYHIEQMYRSKVPYQTMDSFVLKVAEKAFNILKVSHAVRDGIGKDGEKTKIVDSWYNSVTGIGTSSDPGWYNTADIPIQMSPQQASAYYSSGGIPKVIVDKKTNGPFINGYRFEGDFTRKQLDDFCEHYKKRGLTTAMKHGLRDSLIFGGSAIIPHFEQDRNKINYSRNLSMMGPMGDKKIDRFWTADRWNLVLIPNTNIEAEDYFYPPYFYVPMAGVEVCTERMAIIRINELPFWSALLQIGWGISDMESWIKSVLSYNIMINAIPIMGQQISLVYQHIPADPIIFANGPQAFKEWADENSQQLALWSINNPKTFNSYGEIKTLERNYTGYEDLVRLLRENIGAESTIPESSIFHTQSKGFSDNIEDVTLKQSEAFKQIGNIFEEQMNPLIFTMGLDYFGRKNEEKVKSLKLCLDSNTVITNDQKATIGSNFFSMIQMGVSSGMTQDIAGKIASKFISGVNIDDETINMLKEAQEEADKKEEKDRKSQQSKGLFGIGGPKKPGTPAKSSLTPGSKNDQKSQVRKASGKGKN